MAPVTPEHWCEQWEGV